MSSAVAVKKDALLTVQESFGFAGNTDKPVTIGNHTQDQATLMQMRANDYSCGYQG